MEPFVHLNVRSYFSLKDGAFSPEDLVLRAAALGMDAVALTDRDSLYGSARFADACRQVSERVRPIRPIYGATLTVRSMRRLRSGSPRAARTPTSGWRLSPAPRRRAGLDPSPPSDHSVVLLATDAVGYANLCSLITTAHMTGERGDPSLTTTQICERSSGLVCLIGPDSVPGQLATNGFADAAGDALRPWRDAFGSDLYVEVRNRLEPGGTEDIRRLLRLADDVGVRVVATNGVRYLVPEDAFLADVLECMREIVPLATNHVSRTNAEGWLKPADQMRALFAERPDLCGATLDVADRCRFDLRVREVHFPDFPTPGGRSAGSVLAERCWSGMADRGMQPTKEVRDRLDFELAQIHTMGYAAYFLNVADIVDDIRSMGIRCACRGSAAGSLVCYLTRISDVDPVRHGLLFERFINRYRDELPDIDIDVESARREDVYGAILARHGDDRCACVNMVDTYRARGAIREVGKALGLPEGEIDIAAKAFPHIGARQVRVAMEKLPELEGLNLNAGQLELLFRVVERLDGFPRHIALHPSGIVLSGHDLVERVPMERSFQGFRMVQADKDDVEILGLLKLDILGVRMLSAMRHAVDEAVRVDGIKIDLDDIPAEDPTTFELIRRSDTLGCFQIESPGQRELLQKFQPVEWSDLIIDISLFRPGPVKSDMVTPFIKRRHRLQPTTYAHPRLRAVLQESNGVVVYHEQVMRVLSVMGGYDLARADQIRRHLDDEGATEPIHADFVRNCVANGLPEADAEKVWHEVVSFASFGFCKAHAAAFAVPTYQSAWLKAHFPAHFLAGVLTHEPGMYPRRLILEDARHHDIEILPLDVNQSEPDYTVEVVEDGLAGAEHLRRGVASEREERRQIAGSRARRDGDLALRERASSRGDSFREGEVFLRYGIRLALKDVHGISDAEVRSILEARHDRPFVDVGDFLRRTNVSRPVAERLAHSGAFDRLPGGSRRDQLFVAMTADAPNEGEQAALPLDQAPIPPVLRGYTDAETVRAELEVVGVDASRHLLSFYRPVLDDLGVTYARDLTSLRGDAWVMVAGIKVASQTPAVKSGQRIIFLTLDDGTGLVDATVFERVQPWCAKAIFHGFLLAVWGRLRRTGVNGVSVIAEGAWDVADLSRARQDGRLLEAVRAGGPPADQAALEPRPLWGPRRGPSGHPLPEGEPQPAGLGGLVPAGHGMAARGPTRKLWHSSGGSAGR
ncbi:MAG TPA: DNA polymerase III subunit alpha [Actinomycetota bacterium]|nr:DNA polymerase III subunit alpha [Actinomycetota bacterium]